MNAISSSPSSSSNEEIRHLQQQIDELRQLLALSSERRLTLTPNQNTAYLGQSVFITARLLETRSQQPLVAYPVTLFASQGELESVQQSETQRGSAITVHTGADGVVRARWYSQSTVALSQEQQSALESQLSRMPIATTTATSAQRLSALQTLAVQYQWEANYWLRSAVDSLLKEFHPNLGQNQNLSEQNLSVSWPERSVSIVALSQGGVAATATAPASADSSVQSTAVVTLRVIDWLPAWLAEFIQQRSKAAQLDEHFELMKRLVDADFDIGESFRNQVALFASQQRGLAGELASKTIVAGAAERFVRKNLTDTVENPDLPNLSVDQRVSIFNNLASVANNFNSGGIAAIRNDQQNQLSLKANLKTQFVAQEQFSQFDQNLSNRYVAQDDFKQFDQNLSNRYVNQDEFKQFDQNLSNRYVNQDEFKQFDQNLSNRYVAQEEFKQFDRDLSNRYVSQDEFKQFDRNLSERYVNQDQFKELNLEFSRNQSETSERLGRIDQELNVNDSLAERLNTLERSQQNTQRQLTNLSTQVDSRFENTVTRDMFNTLDTRLNTEIRTINNNLNLIRTPIIRGPNR